MNTMTKPTTLPREANPGPIPEWMQVVTRHVEQTDFGQVILTIHQGQVIEVQKVERIRFGPTRKST